MKPLFIPKKAVLLSLMTLIFISCGTYQSVYNNDDGIYDDDDRTVVIVKTEKKHKEINENYFTRELDRVDKINDGDVFTDVDEYTTFSDYELIENETDTINTINPNARITYTDNEPWGHSDNDVVITIDLGYNNWDYWDQYYGYGSYWGYHWRFRHGFYGDYVYAPYYYGYHHFYYYPPYYYHHSNNRYYNYNNNRNYTYGKRSYTSGTSRRYTSVNSRIKTSTNRRPTNTSRKIYNTDRKYTTRRVSPTTTRSSSSTKRNSNTTRSSKFFKKKFF